MTVGGFLNTLKHADGVIVQTENGHELAKTCESQIGDWSKWLRDCPGLRKRKVVAIALTSGLASVSDIHVVVEGME